MNEMDDQDEFPQCDFSCRCGSDSLIKMLEKAYNRGRADELTVALQIFDSLTEIPDLWSAEGFAIQNGKPFTLKPTKNKGDE